MSSTAKNAVATPASKYPAPDRSNRKPTPYRGPDDCAQHDIGAYLYTFADGRPARIEIFSFSGGTFVTVFCSPRGLPRNVGPKMIEYLTPILDREGVPLKYRDLEKGEYHTIIDAAGKVMISITFTVGPPG